MVSLTNIVSGSFKSGLGRTILLSGFALYALACNGDATPTNTPPVDNTRPPASATADVPEPEFTVTPYVQETPTQLNPNESSIPNISAKPLDAFYDGEKLSLTSRIINLTESLAENVPVQLIVNGVEVGYKEIPVVSTNDAVDVGFDVTNYKPGDDVSVIAGLKIKSSNGESYGHSYHDNPRDNTAYFENRVVSSENVNIISEQEFRQGIERLISSGNLEGNAETTELISDVNDYIYFHLTHRDPAEIVSVVLSEEDMRQYAKDTNQYNEKNDSFPGGLSFVLHKNTFEQHDDFFQLLAKYGVEVDESNDELYISITTGYNKSGSGVFVTDNHEWGHLLNSIYSKPWRPVDLDFPQEVNGVNILSGFGELIANIYEAAAIRFVQEKYPDLDLSSYSVSKNESPLNDLMSGSHPHIINSWLTVLGDPNLSYLADELRGDKMLSSSSTLELHRYFSEIPIPEIANYFYGLWTSTDYKSLVDEARGIAFSRLGDISPGKESPFSFRNAEIFMP
tara:strand:- start:3760 stop:5289 length:1530 start_codon:yes stop_codon:yes gene_type:complete